jgi:hypothetical protein
LRRGDYEIVIIESSFFYAIFLLGRLSWNESERGVELGAGSIVCTAQCLRRSGTREKKQPQPAPPGCGHPLHPLNEAAVINRDAQSLQICNIWQGKNLGSDCPGEETTTFCRRFTTIL